MTHAEKETDAGHRTALLIIDIINHFRFSGGGELLARAQSIIPPVLALREVAQAAGCPIIYVNDNFGEWQDDRSRLIEKALEGGNGFTERLIPRDADHFVVKPQFSAFYATNLPVLLRSLQIERLILTGVATDICVLFTAADAHMQGYSLWIPEDAVAAESDERGGWALEIMANAMSAETSPTDRIHRRAWLTGNKGDA